MRRHSAVRSSTRFATLRVGPASWPSSSSVRPSRNPASHGTYDAALALAYSHANRLDNARAIIDRYTSDAFEGVLPNLAMSSGLVLFADAAEITEHVAASRLLLNALEPHGGLLADNGGSVRG